MQAECLPASAIPHVTRLYSDYLAYSPSVHRYYAAHPFDLAQVAARARDLPYPTERRNAVAEALRRQNAALGASTPAFENIERLRRGAAAVVTGQQVTLFGGPLFSLLKAVSAVRLARELTAAGVDAVPVFWLATEDHDLAEVNHVRLITPDGGLRAVRTGSAGREAEPVGDIPLGDAIKPALAEAEQLLGKGADLLRECYAPQETFGSAFGKLFARLFSDSGVILLDSRDAELHRISHAIYSGALDGAEVINRALLARNAELEAAGYHAQVKVTGSSTLLFLVQDGVRTPVLRTDGAFAVGRDKLSVAQLQSRISAEPQNASANVLLRPVVQDYLLPTAAYIGGPAEVAYFAQAEVVYRHLLGRATAALPRLSATLVEPKVKRLIDKYGVSLPEVIAAHAPLEELLAARSLPGAVNDSFHRSGDALEGLLSELLPQIRQLDPTLAEAGEKAGRKMRYQLERLRARAGRALLRRSDDLARHARTLESALLPEKSLQERQVAGIYFVAQYGKELLRELVEHVNPSGADHQVLYL